MRKIILAAICATAIGTTPFAAFAQATGPSGQDSTTMGTPMAKDGMSGTTGTQGMSKDGMKKKHAMQKDSMKKDNMMKNEMKK